MLRGTLTQLSRELRREPKITLAAPCLLAWVQPMVSSNTLELSLPPAPLGPISLAPWQGGHACLFIGLLFLGSCLCTAASLWNIIMVPNALYAGLLDPVSTLLAGSDSVLKRWRKLFGWGRVLVVLQREMQAGRKEGRITDAGR
jgi:hypothetical protein